ncbi:MAG TPA: DUF4038 domain-containing protein [Polyangiaceae bacterium]
MSAAARPLSSGPWNEPVFLAVSPNGRYFTNRGTPFLIHGDTAWSAIVNLTQAEMLTYLDDCQTRGFTAVVVNLFDAFFATDPPNDRYGNAPFVGTQFQSAITTAYKNNALFFTRAAKARSIAVIIDPAYQGFDGGEQGFYTACQAATDAQMRSVGAEIGTTFKNERNIIFSMFGDYNPPSHARVNALRAGITSTHPRALFGAHFGPDVSGHDVATAWKQDWDWIYRYGGFVDSQVTDGFNIATVKPVVFSEGWYEGENSSTALDIRRQAWGAMFGGACGHCYGHRDIWGFGNGLFQVGSWQNAIANTANVAIARTQMAHLLAFFASRPWYLLVPDQGNTFITAGRGTGGTAGYVPAAVASDGSFAGAYLPTGSTGGAITVNKARMSGAFSWTWVNCRTGATSGGASGVAASGTMDITAPDGNDWALRMVVD